MQKSLQLSKPDEENLSYNGNPVDLVCNECGEKFQKPILATVSCSGREQTYYACPRCMVKISRERKEITISKKDVKKPSIKLENSVECKHFLGYLKKRPKDVPIPEECLTCGKMIECLLS